MSTVLLPGDTLPSGSITRVALPSKEQAEKRKRGMENSSEAISQKRYIPKAGDIVVGIVVQKGAELYRVEINGTCLAVLPSTAFNAATKRHKPALRVGSAVLAHVASCSPHGDVVLSCEDPQSKKDWVTKEVLFSGLEDGVTFTVPLSYARSLLENDPPVFAALNKYWRFETAVGANGRIWLSTFSPLDMVLVMRTLQSAHKMTPVQIEAMCAMMHKQFSQRS